GQPARPGHPAGNPGLLLGQQGDHPPGHLQLPEHAQQGLGRDLGRYLLGQHPPAGAPGRHQPGRHLRLRPGQREQPDLPGPAAVRFQRRLPVAPGLALVGDADPEVRVLIHRSIATRTAGATRPSFFPPEQGPYTPTMDEPTTHKLPTVDARIFPRGGLDVLSREEVARLRDASVGGRHELLRRCALAVLTTGSTADDPRAARELYPDFDIQVHQLDRGLRLDLLNAPAMAFVDGQIIHGVAELLAAVVRDLVYTSIELAPEFADELDSSPGITDAVFRLLRNADVLNPSETPNLVVCWGGHSISRDEYMYTKEVGYQLGLRGLDICTGCGPGAMKGPMKGATIAHAKQRLRNSRYIGITEPGIIAAESPNPIVNHL